ncbi:MULTISPECIES: sigma-70 family RNA polymerase sigma factor [Burkholderia]|uniref:sigma-70 family RNA polymerase sigma factor n=1 Tax=Burkholderia TaxID=32008 RepID=UPI00046A12C7|nr:MULTISPECIES: sigma-70 family RNA polymerase sigma factor [Burkholderia]MBU9168865.1 sigma-70 family RNA polymerase sigma factor [Burkholderia gladioli]MBU9216740.1 sigma-70 family RNA polymerase sigma factor [Burkholderia gladioli]MDN7722078.1 sigma-70 family RNA polymerase sigma factor [Burkholderia gladioli]MDN7800718.1 sigma-70 family RNA polymerase sigma factor [Burkholderia gladioli]NIE84982.1 sigma-70 family RNA polymerase sigma factor [Burkholderia sp. Tr-860]
MERTQDSAARQRTEQELRQWLLLGLGGDEAAYRRFLNALSAHLRGFVRRRLASRPSDVEDLVQEMLLAIHDKRHTYRAGEPLTAWVHAIARYKLVDYFRAWSRHEALNDSFDDEAEWIAPPELESSEARRDLGQLLDTLPDRQRLPIVHVKLEGLSVAETARMTGLSESAVKIGVHRGLKALAAKIRGTR